MTSPQIDRQTFHHRGVRGALATPRGEFAVLDAAASGDRHGTVLLVPGYTGSKEDFAPLFDPLSDAGFRVVAIDQRGQYETPGGDDPAEYSLTELGADVVAVCGALGDRVHLVGHSFGGLVVRAAALADPARLASLTLMCTGPSALGPGVRRTVVEAARPHLSSVDLATIYDLGQQRLADDPSWIAPPEALRVFLRERFVRSSPTALEYMGLAMTTAHDRVDELRETGLRTLVLYGAEDNAWPPQVQADMAERLGASEAVIDFAMHSPALENPADTAAALVDFWLAR